MIAASSLRPSRAWILLIVLAAGFLAGCASDGSPSPTGDGGISSLPVEETRGPGEPSGRPEPSTSDEEGPVLPEPTPAETPLDPACLILDADEVSDVLGSPVDNGASVTGGCEWLGEPEDASLQLLTSEIAQAECREAFEGDETQEPVSGLGAPAFSFYDELIGRATVTACLDATMLVLNVTSGAGDPADPGALVRQATELAATAIDQL